MMGSMTSAFLLRLPRLPRHPFPFLGFRGVFVDIGGHSAFPLLVGFAWGHDGETSVRERVEIYVVYVTAKYTDAHQVDYQ